MRFIQFRSAPAQNAAPFAASTTARTCASASSSANVVLSEAISASSNALRTSGRLSVTRATRSFFSMVRLEVIEWLTSHPEQAEARLADRRVQRRRQAEREQAPRVERIDDSVVPQARARIVGMPLQLVLLADRR